MAPEPQNDNCLAPAELRKLRADGTLTEEERGVMSARVVSRTEILRQSICSQTQGHLDRFIQSDYARHYPGAVITKINTFFGDTSTQLNRETFFRCVEIQKEYNRFLESNTLLVYTYFRNQRLPVPSQLTLDGIPGADTQKALDFLIYARTRRQDIIPLPAGTPNVREVVSSTLHTIIGRYLHRLSDRGSVEVSLGAIFIDLKSALEQTHASLHTSRNIFAVDVRNFIDNFLHDENQGKEFIRVFLRSVMGETVTQQEQLSVLYDTFVSGLGFAIDTAKTLEGSDATRKIEEFKNFPLLRDFLSSNPDFERLYGLLPRLARVLPKEDIMRLFATPEAKQDFLKLFDPQVSTTEKTQILKNKFTRLLTLLETHIIPNLSQLGSDDEQKDVLEQVFSLSFFEGFKQTDEYKLINILFKNNVPQYKQILTYTCEILRHSIAGTSYPNAAQFIAFIESTFSTLPPEDKDQVILLSQRIMRTFDIPPTQEETTTTYERILARGKNLLGRFAFWGLARAPINDLHRSVNSGIWFGVTQYVTRYRDSLTRDLGRVLENTLSTGFAQNIGMPVDASTRLRGLGAPIMTQGILLIEQKVRAALARQTVTISLDEVKTIITTLVLQEFPALSGMREQLDAVTILVLGRLGNVGELLRYRIDYAQPEVTPDLQRVECFVDALYLTRRPNTDDTGLKDAIEGVFRNTGYPELTSVSVFGKSLSENFVHLLKYIRKSDFKLVLFENRALLEQLRAPGENKAGIAIELCMKLLAKANIPNNGTEQNQLFLFLRDAPLGSAQRPQEKATLFAATIDQANRVFNLFGERRTARNNPPLNPQQQVMIHRFSQNVFDMIRSIVDRFGPRGIEMAMNGRIYESPYNAQSKQLFFGALEASFRSHSRAITGGREFSLFSEMLGNMFGGSGFTISSETQRTLLFNYFKNPANRVDFQRVIMGVFPT